MKQLSSEELERLLEASIEHHERMKAYAKKLNPHCKADPEKMWEGIQEDWYWKSCPLCLQFIRPESEETACVGCPLDSYDKNCGSDGSPWQLLTWANDWGEFILAENKMIGELSSILMKKKVQRKLEKELYEEEERRKLEIEKEEE